MHRRRNLLLGLPAAASWLAATANLRQATAQKTNAAPLPVVASFSILGDMVRQIGGDRVSVRVIAGPEVDAHAYQPRPSDAGALRQAALLVRNGLGFDAWIDRLIRAAGHAGPVVTAAEGIAPRRTEAHGAHAHGGDQRPSQGAAAPHRHAAPADPHAWQDLRIGQHYARRIGEGLAAADPARAAAHRAAAAAYAARLAELDAWVRAQVATVPPARRKVVTSHEAFGWFGAAYGIEFLAPQGISTEAEPSAAQVARLIRQIRAQGITAVFLEGTAGPATVLDRLAREAGVHVRGGRLYADALSPPDGPAPTYEAMFRHNTGLLVPAMRGE